MKRSYVVRAYAVGYSVKPGNPLTYWTKQYNKLVGKQGYKIERVFGSIQRWFGGLRARYVGLIKTHGQHVLEAMAYNLYRLPGIIVSNV